MVKVSQEEANIIREQCPNVYMTVLNKSKKGSRKVYYCEETREVAKILKKRRGE